MSYNRFVNSDCSFLELGAIPVNQDCTPSPRLSEITTILMLPFGAKSPADWTNYDDISGVIDNSISDNQYAKLIVGKGAIQEGTPVNYNLGLQVKTVGYRKELRFEIPIIYDQQYTLLQKLQSGALNYRFWFGTLGGRFIGGSTGIKPDYSTADYSYLSDENSTETGIWNVGWYEDGAALRTDHFDLLGVNVASGVSGGSPGSGGDESGGTTVNYYYQKFTTGPTLTWTQNSGGLPSANTTAQVMVFQNGQKLVQDSSYTLNPDSAPGESQIIINGVVHWEGSIYEVITIETS